MIKCVLACVFDLKPCQNAFLQITILNGVIIKTYFFLITKSLENVLKIKFHDYSMNQ
jgi:hypothetical protein